MALFPSRSCAIGTALAAAVYTRNQNTLTPKRAVDILTLSLPLAVAHAGGRGPGSVAVYCGTLQGYLTHKKQPPPLAPQQEPRQGPTVGSYGVAVS